MADRAMMYCPTCRNLGQLMNNPALKTIELMRDPDACRCVNGHTFPDYMALMALEPEKIKLVPMEKPQPTDVKIDVWIDKDIWEKFNAAYPHQKNSTVQSIMSLHLYGEPVIIDGVQAEKMRKLGVRNGQEMLAALEVAKTLEAQLQTAEEKIAIFQGLFSGAGIQAPV